MRQIERELRLAFHCWLRAGESDSLSEKIIAELWHDFSLFSALSSVGSYELPQRRTVMKNTRLNSILSSGIIACALAIGSLASTQSASAQTTIAKVTIPFDFQMGSKTLPAGTYRVERESANLILLEGSGKASSFILMNAASRSKAPDHGIVSFDRTGDKYYLRRIWTAGNQTGLECPKSRAEKEALVATNNEAATTVELAFNSDPQK
jgi:hypothetical protein